MHPQQKEAWFSTLTLFTSLGTLLCCALPALLVTLGMGAALAGLVASVPALVWLSEYKIVVFVVAGVLLLVGSIVRYAMRNAPCPVDLIAARACMRLRRISLWLYGIALVAYLVGFFFAFIAVHIFF